MGNGPTTRLTAPPTSIVVTATPEPLPTVFSPENAPPPGLAELPVGLGNNPSVLTALVPVPTDNAANSNDISDIHIVNPDVSPIPPMQLPIRGEKRFIPENAMALVRAAISKIPTTNPTRVSTADFFITAAKRAFTDYVTVSIPHRGIDPNSGNPNPGLDATYRFLINPQTVQVTRSTEDSQTFARGGWQFGLWGESLSHVSLSGHTPGQYFTYGLTDEYAYLSESWRNLQQLVMVYENNGYWFEGEEANEGPLAPNFIRRRIKKHQDVILTVANFIWYGMFDELSVTLDAEHPFRAEFRLSFLAWKERFRQGSPYSQWGIRNNNQRGHSYGASAYTAQEQPPVPPAGQTNTIPLASGIPSSQSLLSGSPVFQQLSVLPNSAQGIPALQAASFNNLFNLPADPQASSATFVFAGSPDVYKSLVLRSTGN